IDIEGTNPKQLTSGGSEALANFSADGRWVIYDGIATADLRKVPIDGGDSVRLTERRVVWPTVSAQNGMIAGLYSTDGTSPRLTVFAPDGGVPVKTFDLPPGRFSHPRWSADGQAILYFLDRGETSSLWSQPLDGGAPKQL